MLWATLNSVIVQVVDMSVRPWLICAWCKWTCAETKCMYKFVLEEDTASNTCIHAECGALTFCGKDPSDSWRNAAKAWNKYLPKRTVWIIFISPC